MMLDIGNRNFIELSNTSKEDYEAIKKFFINKLNSEEKVRDAITDSFCFAIDRCSKENVSDIWHHIIYRLYHLLYKGIGSPAQSWVRTSGEALELFIVKKYNPILGKKGIRLTPLIKNKGQAFERMKISAAVGSSKLDILIEKKDEKKGFLDGYGIIGGIHSKASLAERISDDIPASRSMMQAGFVSILWTLDVKSSPPRDYTNHGEFGTPEKPTHKRLLIEERGDFNVCFSYNSRTIPSHEHTKSGRHIYTVDISESPDAFVKFCEEL